MSDTLETAEFKFAGDDVVVPFAVEPLDVRGRAIQIGPMLDRILKRHEYPDEVCFLLAELVVLATLLGTSLKFKGNFIVQTQSDGPVSLTVVDFSTPGSIRAYARFDKLALAAAVEEGRTAPRDLLGNGVMALTVDQGAHMQRYQGIVELKGDTLEEVAHQYFRQSEQIPTRIRLTVAQILRRETADAPVEQRWRAGGMMTQFLPESQSRVVVRDLPGGNDEDEEGPDEDNAWLEASALMDTIADDELSDPQLNVERLLYRLFHEHGVRVFDGTAVTDECSCSREKVIALVRNFEEEKDGLDDGDGGIETKCEFCSTVYNISAEELLD